MASAELLLHPVRLRIVQAFLGARTLTTGELRRGLPDIPAATLYRQVAALAAGGVLEVVAERKVRGAFERTYRLLLENASVTSADAATMRAPEHRQAFGAFAAALMADFDRYLARGEPDLARDGVGFRQAAMHLSDDDLREMLRQLSATLAPWLAQPPGPGRTRRLVSTVIMPA